MIRYLSAVREPPEGKPRASGDDPITDYVKNVFST